jgi:beta-glucosidase/6-phospho-beta-glucosidase/beta-galactosidase
MQLSSICANCKVYYKIREEYFITLITSAFCVRYMDPLTKGEYPKSMRSMVGNRLPKFSKEESAQLRGSFDFLGLNYYSSFYAANAPQLRGAKPAQQTDNLVNVTSNYQVNYTLSLVNSVIF